MVSTARNFLGQDTTPTRIQPSVVLSSSPVLFTLLFAELYDPSGAIRDAFGLPYVRAIMRSIIYVKSPQDASPSLVCIAGRPHKSFD